MYYHRIMTLLAISSVVNSLVLLALALALGLYVGKPAPPVSRLPDEARRLVRAYERAGLVLAAFVLVSVILFFAGVSWVRLGGVRAPLIIPYFMTLMLACRLMVERLRRRVQPV